jgi:hypothetical protein
MISMFIDTHIHHATILIMSTRGGGGLIVPCPLENEIEGISCAWDGTVRIAGD